MNDKFFDTYKREAVCEFIAVFVWYLTVLEMYLEK